MMKYSYCKLSNSKKIRYLKHDKDNGPFIIFLHGFMSDLEGKKPKHFLKFAKKNNYGFLALEYSGHGKSSGKFINGNISKWTKETTLLIKQIIGFLGIGSAPEFLENLMWKKFNKSMKREIIQKGIINLKHGKYEYPITLQLIKDGRKNKILKKNINQKLNVTMVHGEKDESVPVVYSRKVLKLFKNARKKLVIIKNGDHSLSSKKWLKILTNELNLIL